MCCCRACLNTHPARAGRWFKGQRWAQPSQSHMQQLMREVMNNRRQAWAKGLLARERVQKEFSILVSLFRFPSLLRPPYLPAPAPRIHLTLRCVRCAETCTALNAAA